MRKNTTRRAQNTIKIQLLVSHHKAEAPETDVTDAEEEAAEAEAQLRQKQEQKGEEAGKTEAQQRKKKKKKKNTEWTRPAPRASGLRR
jgi:hypothetical protein